MCTFATPVTLLPMRLFPQDENNARGGKWMVRLKKGLASHLWEELVRGADPRWRTRVRVGLSLNHVADLWLSRVVQLLAVVGEQFDVGNEICGAVVSIRHSEDIISVWNRNADNADALAKIRCGLLVFLVRFHLLGSA